MIHLRSNAHMHTTFCDGKNTPEEMLRVCLDHNFISAGFSIHGWTPYDSSIACFENESEYRTELMRLRSIYSDRIEILIGIERDALYKRACPEFDYIIDSTHYIEKDGILLAIDYSEEDACNNVNLHFGGDWYAYTRAYFAREAEVCASSDADFIGHIDLVSKYNEGNRYFNFEDPRYLKPAIYAADCALERHLPIEINSGAISRGYRTTPYPSPVLLRHIREKNGEIIINSDAHAAKDVDCAFDACIKLAMECGFDHVLRLRKSGFEEVSLY